jgi:Cd2+/Zn2+-exporting ATPase
LVASTGQWLRIPDMDCIVEENEIRRALGKINGIRNLQFRLGQRALLVDAPDAVVQQAIAAIGQAGFALQPIAAREQDAAACGSCGHNSHPGNSRRELAQMGGALGLALLAEGVHFFAPHTLPWTVVSMAIAALAIALSGFAVYRKGLQALLRGKLNVNALMAVAVTGAFLVGQWPEAAMVMALYTIAEWLEARAVDRARNAIRGLLDLAPLMAEVRQADGSWLSQLAQSVAVGGVVRVKPGERLALDGRVVAGRSAIDQAPVTGESIPVEKGPGDAVFAGTINQHGALEYEVTAPATDTVLARIIHAVEEAQGKRAPTQRFVDRFAAAYTPAVFVISLAVAVLGPWLAGWTWLEASYKALVILVIACPCALVISTPMTVVSGLAAAAKRGILIKGGVYLEEARKLTRIAMDKTGTITEGKPRLVAREIMRSGVDEARIWQLAAGMAARSDHPVSKAIAQDLAGDAGPLPEVEAFAAEAGRGTHGRIDGLALVLGNHRWVHECGRCSPELEARMAEHERLGRSVSILADEQGALALLAVADTIKQTSQQAVRELQAMGITPVMLTGDNQATAQAIAAAAGISEVQAGLLPQQKLQAIQEQGEKSSNTIGMVGDGINDAPALAAAHVGFAMGQVGTHTATEAADVVIMNDDLRRVPETVRLSKRVHGVLWQNIVLALGIKAVFLLLAVTGKATMWMAVFADVGASLLVVFNGLRLLRWRG